MQAVHESIPLTFCLVRFEYKCSVVELVSKFIGSDLGQVILLKD